MTTTEDGKVALVVHLCRKCGTYVTKVDVLGTAALNDPDLHIDDDGRVRTKKSSES